MAKPGILGRSSAQKSNEGMRIIFSAVVGVMLGYLFGISFPTVNITKLHFPSSIISYIEDRNSGITTQTLLNHAWTSAATHKKNNSASNSDEIPKIYVPTNPKGAERLPPGIVVSETDLYLRRLWGEPSEDLTSKPRYLVTFTVGYAQKANIDAAVRKFSENFTIMLFHYDDRITEWDEFEWSKRAIHVSVRKQTKWWYAKRFLHPDIVARYDYIFIWDEDLGVEHFNAEAYIGLVRKHGLEISQPGLEPDKGLTWQMTKRIGDQEVHKVTEERPGWCSDPHLPPCAAFVEIMATVFSRDAWRCVWHMIQNDLVHGWGATLLISHQPPPTPLTIQANPPNTKKNPRPPAPSPAVSLHRRRHHLVLPLPSYRGMEHDAHAVPPSEDATVDDWARDDAEPMSVESGVAPAELAAADSGADAPHAPSPSAAVAAEGVKEIQSSLQSLDLKTNVATQEDAHVVEDDVDETKRHLNVVFIGHVDAGKSTTGGQILFLSGQVDDRTIQKYEKEAKDKSRESWYMAYIMDTNEEERVKGKTVEVGRAHFETEHTRFTILDAPGHKSYVPNMISGASQADIGVLVISARKGEFETGYERGGQTREHVLLAKTLGVAKLVVVINKMDEPTVKWSKERYDEIEAKMVPFLKSSGYNVKKDVQFLPISGLVGTNMKTRMDKSICSWWDGPCLFEVLDRIEVPLRDPKGPVRMPIIDKYKDMGTVVMGKIESGTIREGDSLLVMPNKSHVKVVGLNLDESKVRRAGPAENVRVKLSGVEEEDVMAGFVLSSVANPVGAVSEFIAQLQILELLDNAIFTAGYKAVLHIHSVVEECEIVELIEEIDMKKKKEADPKKKKPKRKPLFVKNGAIVVCRIQVNNLICVEKFSDFPQLGRFTLRTEGKTVAVGKVVDVPPAGSPTF